MKKKKVCPRTKKALTTIIFIMFLQCGYMTNHALFQSILKSGAMFVSNDNLGKGRHLHWLDSKV